MLKFVKKSPKLERPKVKETPVENALLADLQSTTAHINQYQPPQSPSHHHAPQSPSHHHAPQSPSHHRSPQRHYSGEQQSPHHHQQHIQRQYSGEGAPRQQTQRQYSSEQPQGHHQGHQRQFSGEQQSPHHNHHPPLPRQYSGEQLGYTTQSGYSGQSNSFNRSETPPPLPPPPPQEVLDSIPPPRQFDEHHNYDGQNIVYEHSNSSGTSRSSDPQFIDRSQLSYQPAQPKQMSTLTNNLSELDQLLQDLNSAQFMAEVDKRNVSNQQIVVNGGGGGGEITPNSPVKSRQPPPVAPKPGRNENRNTVDSLLDQLESSIPDRANNYRGPAAGENDNYEYTPDHQSHHQHQNQANIQQHQQQFQQQQHQEHHQFNQHENYPPAINSMNHAQQNHVQQMPGPSTATRELDDLMATLSEFKVSNAQQKQQQMSMPHARSPSPNNEPSYARPQKSRNSSQSSQQGPMNVAMQQQQQQQQQQQSATGYPGQLESMLGDLQSDMNRQGVSTVSKGTCGACNQPVIGQVITALGKVWHIEHFVCGHCSLPLGTKNFYERDGAAYCEEDYHRLFAPKCAYCNGPIVDKCVTAIGKTWHPEHFFCAQCGRPFGEDGFHERDGHAYCREDYLERFAPRCGGCGRPILDNYISALSRHWHPECFVCRECHMSFGGRSFFDHEGQPYCETHYHLKRGSLCASCQKPITGRCITAMYKKFHPEHFVCAFCLKQLNKGTFKEQNDKPYCHPCFVKLFG